MTEVLAPAAPPTPHGRLGRVVTEVLAPPCIGAATLLLLGWRGAGLPGLLEGAVAALLVTVLPYAVVIIGVRSGRWKDRMLTTRRQRIVPILSNIAFAIAGLIIAILRDAPLSIAAFIIAAIGTQAILFVINLAWKISFHAGVSTGIAIILASEFSPTLLVVLIPLVVLVGWARVAVREHTVAQVLVGAPVGGASLALIYQYSLTWL
ncbi:phosphatidic acid phosphatase [Actinotalea ferrariae]|uniref:phosphatidic acid phosphatase n=1 Tax=Actinotalea ferrariae TaxID=1386098 RepID=UPI001C8C4235|nr:phosphatidic acid phosphatase [Actinotalea ferrariae]MBX9244631.1 phosphatidic acid phosphatase [Actinotalea ferrariae]